MRTFIANALDQLIFRVNTFPIPDYQPIPWLGIHRARRGEGTDTRLMAICDVIQEQGGKSCVDIGCNTGFFAIALADLGLAVVGIEGDPRYVQIMNHTIRRTNKRNVGVLALQLNLENAELIPMADCILFLSVWHHVVMNKGLVEATDLLRRIWDKTQKVLFFETGELEMPPRYNLPDMRPAPKEWITGYLFESLCGVDVLHLGVHMAFAPDGKRATRNLFACVRRGDA